MKSKSKLIFLIGFFIILLVGAGIYFNYRLENLLNQTGMLMNNDIGTSTYSKTSLSEAPPVKNESPNKTGSLQAKTGTSSQTNHNNIKLGLNNPANKTLVTHVQQKIGQNIEKKDILLAGFIIMRKLSKEDISYLSKVAMKSSYNQEDYRKSREILLDRLSPNDINILKEMGKKYGSELQILNSNTNL